MVIGLDDVSAAVGVVHAERASILVAVPETALDEAESLVERGWTSPSAGPPPEVLEWLAPRDGIALWPVGRADDRESGVVALATPTVVTRLAAAITALGGVVEEADDG